MLLDTFAIFAILGSTVYFLNGFAHGHPVNPNGLDHDESPSEEVLGLKDIPVIGLGTWNSDRNEVAPAVEYALNHGYRHIDAARAYHNEDKTGHGLAMSKIKRKKVWITSKLWNDDHRPAYVRAGIEATLTDLDVTHLDLYLMHWPVAFYPHSSRIDHSVSILETWRAMEDLVRANLTRHIGVSNFSPAELEVILSGCTICPYAHQFETHPYLQQQEFVNYHHERGIKVIAYSPLANTNPGYHGDAPQIMKDPFWVELAAMKHATVAQTVLAWGMARGTIVIPKSVHEKYLKENLGALYINFTEEEMQIIAERDRRLRFNDPGKGWGVPLFKGLDDPTRLDDGDEL